MVTSPPPVDVCLQPWSVEPGAQRDVLRVAELRGGERLALEVRRAVDAVADDELRAAGGRAGDDADRLAVKHSASVLEINASQTKETS